MVTPYIWATGLHLLFGNILIGIVEALLLAKFAGCRETRAVGILIAANYVSAWLGYYFIFERQMGIDITIDNLKLWFYLSMAIALLFTIIIEFPFFWYALKETKRKLGKALKMMFIIHCVSYSGLIAWYLLVSETSVMKKLEVVDYAEINLRNNYVLYYRTADNKQLKKLNLNGMLAMGMKVEDMVYSELLDKVSKLDIYQSLEDLNQKQIDLEKTLESESIETKASESDLYLSDN